ncbi:MAG TPA: hypothetical protein VGJ32_10535 [Solirubrobacteraceae bacterium]|jgi:hypothetical protein
MGRAQAQIVADGRLTEAEALWYDTSRWPTFVDGFGHLVSADANWPREGAVIWDSRPGGRGRVLERVVRYAAGDGQDADVEDERITGTQSVRFAPVADGGVGVSLELRYALKRAYPGSALVDALFIRRAMRDSLARTLRRFAIELAAQGEL